MNSIRFNSLYVIYNARVTKIPTVPRREKPMDDISLIGKETLRWSQLEADCRLCGNDSEVVSGASVTKSRHDMIM